MDNDLKFVQIATSESSSMEGSNGENLYGLTAEGDLYYNTFHKIERNFDVNKDDPADQDSRGKVEERIYGFRKMPMINLDKIYAKK